MGRRFQDGREAIKDGERTGLPNTLVTDENVEKLLQHLSYSK